MIPSPAEDAPWLPQMNALNDVIAPSTADYPSERDIDGTAALSRKIAVPETHAFTATGANHEEE